MIGIAFVINFHYLVEQTRQKNREIWMDIMGIIEVKTCLPWFKSRNTRDNLFRDIELTNWVLFLYLASTYDLIYVFLTGLTLCLHPISLKKPDYYSWIVSENSGSYFTGITFYTIAVWYKRILFSSTGFCRLLHEISPMNKITTAYFLNDYLEWGVHYDINYVDIVIFLLL